MEIIKLPIEVLVPYEKNAKIHTSEQIEQIKNSILEFGNNDPIAVDNDNVIIEGHGRLLALKELGYKEVEVIRLGHMSEDQRKAYTLIHNKLTMNTGFDMDILFEELKSIEGIDMSEFDFDMSFDDPTYEDVEEDDYEVVVPENANTKLGQVYRLGNHKLMCGDSTKLEDVQKLLAGEQVDLLLTDPPYNVALGMGGSVDEARKRHRRTDGLVIMNDKMEDSEFLTFLTNCFTVGREALKEGASFYIWHADNEGLNFRMALRDAGLKLRQTLIWNKNSITLGRQDYQWKHEPCLYGWKDGAGHKWFSDRCQATVLDFKRPTRSEEHPTMKPVELFAYQIGNSTKENETVLDLFGGSGTTMIACEQLNRKSYTMELDPKYCDVIINRWETLTGKKAELLED